MTNSLKIIYDYINGTGMVWIYGLVLLVVFIYTVAKLRKQAREAEDTRKRSSGDLLKAKYERGEISKVEYEKKKKEMGKK